MREFPPDQTNTLLRLRNRASRAVRKCQKVHEETLGTAMFHRNDGVGHGFSKGWDNRSFGGQNMTNQNNQSGRNNQPNKQNQPQSGQQAGQQQRQAGQQNQGDQKGGQQGSKSSDQQNKQR
jgi:hypothetical protein